MKEFIIGFVLGLIIGSGIGWAADHRIILQTQNGSAVSASNPIPIAIN